MTDEEFRTVALSRSTNSGALLTFAIYAGLVLGLLFGVPYVYRLLTNGWAHGSASYMGSWVGTIAAPAPEHRQIDFGSLPAWYRRDGDQQEYERSQAAADRAAKQQTRAVMLTLALDPFHLGSASLRGTLQFCDASGQITELKYTTAFVDDQAAKLIAYSKQSNDFGNLDLVKQAAGLQVRYSGFDTGLSGTLTPGDKAAFDTLCSAIQKKAD